MKRVFETNKLTSGLNIPDNKAFSRIVWAHLIGLIILGFFCAAAIYWLIVVTVNFFLQTKVETVTGIILFTCFSFTMGVGLILSAKR